MGSSSPQLKTKLDEAISLEAEPIRSNVLVLDGGGVRGLSSLLILQELMKQVNLGLLRKDPRHKKLYPHDVFQLVAGTSTGGLIALMLGCIGLSVEQCIEEYELLSKKIFGKKRMVGRMSGGLAAARYSGDRLRKCVGGLLQKHKHPEDLVMDHGKNKTACAVICREHSGPSQYSSLISKAVPICSLPCDVKFICKICDAARATSAAPTYFPVMKIDDRYFSDGGLEHNNPSFAIYFHYTSPQRKKSTRPGGSAPDYSHHDTFDSSCTRFVNIGTGARHDDVRDGKRDRLADLVPSVIRRGMFLKTTLKKIAVNSQRTVEMMDQFAALNPKVLSYEPFDADHGVSEIHLDRYDALHEIKKKTNLYLANQSTMEQIGRVGEELASDYRRLHPIDQSRLLSPPPVDDHLHSEPDLSIHGSSAATTQSNHSSDHLDSVMEILDAKSDESIANGCEIVTDIPA